MMSFPVGKLVRFGVAIFVALGASVSASPSQAPAAPSDAPRAVDVDALAARFTSHQDLYRQLRDEGFAYLASIHPKPEAVEGIKTIIRLDAYQFIWNDRFYDGLTHQGYEVAVKNLNTGEIDWLGNISLLADRLYRGHSADDRGASYNSFALGQMLATGYPGPFKMRACQLVIKDLSNYKTESHADPSSPVFKMMPVAIAAWGEAYRKLIRDKWPHDLLDAAGVDLLCVLQNDEPTLDLAIAEIDRDFNEADPSNPVKIALDGEYFTDAAWCARGSSWANSVTEDGWKVFAERLAKADAILEAGFAKYPQEGEMAVSMITVELGQGQGRDRMESWFQKAIKADPDNFNAYAAKQYYLQPRWYGSVEDLLSFGQECVNTGRWEAAIPMVLTRGIAQQEDLEKTIYTRDDVWPVVEKTYRTFLQKYPQSIGTRTVFALHAVAGGHLDVAREQLKILGPDWDRDSITQQEYDTMMQQLGSK